MRKYSRMWAVAGVLALSGGALPVRAETDALPSFDDSATKQEEQIRTLTGQVEELTYRLREAEKKVDRLHRDQEVRFRDLEKRSSDAATPDAAADATVPAARSKSTAKKGDVLPLGSRESASVDDAIDDELPDPPVAKKKVPAGGDYAAGLEAYRDKDYKAAEQSFKAAIANKKDKNTGSALYWLGETYYAQKSYKNAAGAFLDSYKRYPDGSKAPMSLYKLGISLFALDRNTEGCKVVREVRTRYASDTALKAQATAALSRHNCG